jgi:hypothetical protein
VLRLENNHSRRDVAYENTLRAEIETVLLAASAST